MEPRSWDHARKPRNYGNIWYYVNAVVDLTCAFYNHPVNIDKLAFALDNVFLICINRIIVYHVQIKT